MRPHRVWAPSPSEWEALRRMLDADSSGRDQVSRASAVLFAADGLDHREIARRLGLAQPTVTRWVKRFQREGIDGLADRSRRREKIVNEIASMDRGVLASWADSDHMPTDVRRRAHAMVLLADGVALKDICRVVGVSGPVLWKWRHRYQEHGVHGLCSRYGHVRVTEVPNADRMFLDAWARDGAGEAAVPARIILLAADGVPTHRIAERVGRSPTAVRNWLKKYRDGGLDRIRPGVATRARGSVRVPPEERARLAGWLERPEIAADEDALRRGRAVLLAAEGTRIKDIATRLHVQPGSVSDWLRRYRAEGLNGLVTRQGGRRPKHGSLSLTTRDREVLELWADSRALKPHVVRRARAVLLTADGESPSNTAAWSRMSPSSVVKWVDRYLASGVATLLGPDAGSGAEVDEPKLVLTTFESPEERFGSPYWNPELLSDAIEQASPGTVAKIWSRWGLRPARMAPWQFASIPKIAVADHEVVGLYLNVPDRMLVLGSRPRTSKSLLTLYTELQAAPAVPGDVDESWHEQHLRFLENLARLRKRLWLICEPGGSHQHPRVAEWLARHPSISVHLPPTSVSWRSFVTVWFGIIARGFRDQKAAFVLADGLAGELDRFPSGAEFTWIAHGGGQGAGRARDQR